MRPDEILRARIDLLGKAESGGLFPMIMRDILSENIDDWQQQGTVDPRNTEALFTSFLGSIKGAYSYRVTPDMTDLLVAAADGLDDTDRFDRNLAPTGCGIVRFDKPLELIDVRGRTMLVHWLLWGPIKLGPHSGGTLPAVAMYAFNDIYTKPDVYSQKHLTDYSEYADLVGRWGFIGATVTPNGDQVGEPRVELNAHTVDTVLRDGDTPVEPSNLTRYMHAFWLMLNQTIVRLVDEPASRHTRKAMKRMKMPDTVTVIELRRTEPSEYEGESNVEWSHRWIVRGHWAWRVCGPDHPDAQPYKDGHGVRLWIHSYQKGPPDKPLVVTDKLYDLRR